MAVRTQPRSAPKYDWNDDGAVSQQGHGIYILQPSVRAVVKKPSWFATLTVIRPYPCLSFTNPETEFEPYRIIEGDRIRFSDWIRRYACAWTVGQPSTTFLIKKQTKVYDPWTSPIGVLYKAIENACRKQHPRTAEWQPLRESGGNKSKALAKPKDCYLMQGAILRHDKNEYLGKNGPPLGWGKNSSVVFMLSSDTGQQLVNMLSQENDGYSGPDNDFEARYRYGDPVSPLFGRYFHFWQKGTDPAGRYQSSPAEQVTSWDQIDSGADGSVSASGQQRQEVRGFDLEIDKTFANIPATFNQVGEQQIRDHWQHWDDILYFPTEVEQAHMLGRCFPATAVHYAFWGHNRDWVSDEILTALKNPVSTTGGQYREPPGFGGAANQDSFAQGSSRQPPRAPVENRPANEIDPFGGGNEHTVVEDTTVPQRPVAATNPATAAALAAVAVDTLTAGAKSPAASKAEPPSDVVSQLTADAIARLAAVRDKMR